VTDQKLQQAEDSYTQAKLLYDEITDELYDELPSFFDRLKIFNPRMLSILYQIDMCL